MIKNLTFLVFISFIISCSQGFTKIETVKNEDKIKVINELYVIYKMGDVDEEFSKSFKASLNKRFSENKIQIISNEKNRLSLSEDYEKIDSSSRGKNVLEIQLENYTRLTKSYKLLGFIKDPRGEKIWAIKMGVPMSHVYLVVAGFPNPSGTGIKAARKFYNQLVKDGLISK